MMTIIPKRSARVSAADVAHISYATRHPIGEAALVASIIATATTDYLCGDEEVSEDAAAYFMGQLYRNHLQWLGLPGDFLPEMIGTADVRPFEEQYNNEQHL